MLAKAISRAKRLPYRILQKMLSDPYGSVGSRNKDDREVWLVKTLSAIPEGSRILDAGAGEAQYARLCAHLEYLSQDFGKYDGKGNGGGYQRGTWDQSKIDMICDITSIPEPDNSFDAIMCVEVFEHIPEPIAAIREFSRLLKSGGRLILTAPFCSLTHLSPYHFYSGYNRHFYEQWLPEFGLEVMEIEYNGNYFEYLAQEIRRVAEIANKYCGKPSFDAKELLGIDVVLGLLNSLSLRDRGSSELLCFGLHVLAKKRREKKVPRLGIMT